MCESTFSRHLRSATARGLDSIVLPRKVVSGLNSSVLHPPRDQILMQKGERAPSSREFRLLDVVCGAAGMKVPKSGSESVQGTDVLAGYGG